MLCNLYLCYVITCKKTTAKVLLVSIKVEYLRREPFRRFMTVQDEVFLNSKTILLRKGISFDSQWCSYYQSADQVQKNSINLALIGSCDPWNVELALFYFSTDQECPCLDAIKDLNIVIGRLP